MLYGAQSMVNLQATISAATAGTGDNTIPVLPHHPITCSADLYFNEDGDLSCTHAKAPHGDARTQASLNHSVACLIVELACQL